MHGTTTTWRPIGRLISTTVSRSSVAVRKKRVISAPAHHLHSQHGAPHAVIVIRRIRPEATQSSFGSSVSAYRSQTM